MKNKIDFNSIILNEKFANLKLTKQEVIDNYLTIKKIIDTNNECLNHPGDECVLGGYHINLIRNKFNKLEIITTNCENKKIKKSLNIKNNYIYSDINISKNKQLLNKENIIVNNNDIKRISFIKFLLKMKKTKELNSFYLYGPISTGKSFLAIALCNELALLNFKIAVINMNIFSSNISCLEKDERTHNQFIEKLKMVDVLVVDEIGAETINKFAHFDNLYPILIYRLENNLPIFFISNLSIDKLLKNYLLDNTWKRNENQIKLFVNRIEKIVGSNIYNLTEKIAL